MYLIAWYLVIPRRLQAALNLSFSGLVSLHDAVIMWVLSHFCCLARFGSLTAPRAAIWPNAFQDSCFCTVNLFTSYAHCTVDVCAGQALFPHFFPHRLPGPRRGSEQGRGVTRQSLVPLSPFVTSHLFAGFSRAPSPLRSVFFKREVFFSFFLAFSPVIWWGLGSMVGPLIWAPPCLRPGAGTVTRPPAACVPGCAPWRRRG